MTSQPLSVARSDFSSASLLDELPLGSHDTPIAGDTITTLNLNSEWRKFLASAIGVYFSIATRSASQSQLDTFDPLLADLFDDFYNGEVSSMLALTEVTRSTTQAVTASGGNQAITFDAGNGFDAGNPTRLTPPAGVHDIVGNCRINLNSTGRVQLKIRLNGTDYLGESLSNSSTPHSLSIAAQYDFDGMDYVELIVENSVNGTVQNGSPKPTLQVVG